jgi:hypothetical protein
MFMLKTLCSIIVNKLLNITLLYWQPVVVFLLMKISNVWMLNMISFRHFVYKDTGIGIQTELQWLGLLGLKIEWSGCNWHNISIFCWKVKQIECTCWQYIHRTDDHNPLNVVCNCVNMQNWQRLEKRCCRIHSWYWFAALFNNTVGF